MPPIVLSSATLHVNMFWITMPPVTVMDHSNSVDLSRRHSKHGGFHPRNATMHIETRKLGHILSEERENRYDHQPGRRRAVYEEMEDTTQTTSIKRIPAVNRYQLFPNASSSSFSSSSLNKITRNASWRFTSSGGARPSGNKEDVNLMIIPFGALFLFIVVCLLYVSRWCIEDIREADRAVVTVTSQRQTDGTTRYVTNQSFLHPRRNESCDESGAFVFGQSVANYNRSMAASQLNVGGRRNRTMKIAPARSTRSLNGLRANSSGERLTRSAIRRINNAGSSSSSIPLTDLSSTSTLLLGSHRTIEHDEIVESCRRAVGNLLQNHIVVVPIDMTGYGAGQFTCGGGRVSHNSTRIRTRNNSSPAAATFSTAPAHRTSGIASEHSPVGGCSSEASQTGSYCSDSRPLLGRYSSSSDGRIQMAEERMTSSDSNIDAKTGSPVSSRRRLQAMDNKRRGIACGTPSVINKKPLGVMHHQSNTAGRPQRRGHTYQQQCSVPAVSKLVYDSLNLSFRFFQVPAAVESSHSSSGKESLDSVFMGGGVIAMDEVHSSGIASSSRRATHPNVERESSCSGALLSANEDQPTETEQSTLIFDGESQNKNNVAGLFCERDSRESAQQLQVVTVHRGAESADGDLGTRSLTVVGGSGRSFAPASIGRRSSSTAESAIYSASASADTLPGAAADSVVHSRLSESDRIKGSSSSSASLAAGRAATRRSMSSSELHLQLRLQEEHVNGVTGE